MLRAQPHPGRAEREDVLQRHRRGGQRPPIRAHDREPLDLPAMAISELKLHGYAIEGCYDNGRLIGVPLLEPTQPIRRPSRRRRRRSLTMSQRSARAGQTAAPGAGAGGGWRLCCREPATRPPANHLRLVKRVQTAGIWMSDRAGCYRRLRPQQPICDGKHTYIDTSAGPVFGVPEPRWQPAADRHRCCLPLAAVAGRSGPVNSAKRSRLAALVTTDKLAGGIAAARAHTHVWRRRVRSAARVGPDRLRAAAGRRAQIVCRGPTARRDRRGSDRPASTLRIACARIAHTQRPRVPAQTA